MGPGTAGELLELNRRFYDEYGEAFAATRRRIQPGVGRLLTLIPRDCPSDWLDLGCGSGALGKIWAEQGRSGSYTGMDFSTPLLNEARTGAGALSGEKLLIRYVAGNLMDPDWTESFAARSFDGILALASLHHIPGRENHLRIFSQVRDLLKDDGVFYFSVWQFQNSPRLMKRVLPWTEAGISETDLEQGDTLLDWRANPGGNNEKPGLRYVHLFTEDELRNLAQDTGFRITEFFYSDGMEGNLSLYCGLKKS